MEKNEHDTTSESRSSLFRSKNWRKTIRQREKNNNDDERHFYLLSFALLHAQQLWCRILRLFIDVALKLFPIKSGDFMLGHSFLQFGKPKVFALSLNACTLSVSMHTQKLCVSH